MDTRLLAIALIYCLSMSMFGCQSRFAPDAPAPLADSPQGTNEAVDTPHWAVGSTIDEHPADFHRFLVRYQHESSLEVREQAKRSLDEWSPRARVVPSEWIEALDGGDVPDGLELALSLEFSPDEDWRTVQSVLRTLSRTNHNIKFLSLPYGTSLNNVLVSYLPPGLRSLELGGGWKPNFELLTQVSFEKLTDLNVRGSRIDDEMLAWLGENGKTVFPQLEGLNLSGNRFSYSALAGVMLQTNFPSLRRIELGPGHLLTEEVPGVVAVLESPALAELEDITINGSLSSETFELLLPALSKLPIRRLDLRDNYLSTVAVEALASSGLSPTELDLSRNELDDQAVRVLLNAEFAHGLRYLDLGLNRLTDDAITELTRASALQNLEFLGLRGVEISPKSFGRLVSSDLFRRLKRVDLRNLCLSPAHIEEMTTLSRPTSLVELNFSSNRIRDDGAEEFAKLISGSFPELEVLSLANNELRDRGATALLVDVPPSWRVLDLSRNRIRLEIDQRLMSRPALETLALLDLGANEHTGSSIEALSEIAARTGLTLRVTTIEQIRAQTSDTLADRVQYDRDCVYPRRTPVPRSE